jgi:hypothetical protein
MTEDIEAEVRKRAASLPALQELRCVYEWEEHFYESYIDARIDDVATLINDICGASHES